MWFVSKASWLGLCVVLGLTVWASLRAQPPTDKRLPVPNKEAQAKALKLIDDIFGDDVARAITAEEKVKLAGQIFREGAKSQDEPANRYVCYLKARDLAAEGESLEAVAFIDEISHAFKIGPQEVLDMKAVTLTTVAASNRLHLLDAQKELDRTKDEKIKSYWQKQVDGCRAKGKDIVGVIGPLIRDAMESDNYETALALGKVAKGAAKLSKVDDLEKAVEKRIAEVLDVQKGFTNIQPFVDRIQKDAKDTEAQFEVGRYYAVLKGNWRKALPHLAAAGDSPFQPLAAKDLAHPKDAHEQLALADAWWKLSGREKEPDKLALQRRAAFWYDHALRTTPRLSGLSSVKAIKRIQFVEARRTGIPGDVTPVAGSSGLLKKMEGHSEDVKSVAFSPDGRYAVSGGVDLTARVWDLTTGKEEKVLKGHSKQIWSVAFNMSSREVLTASWDGSVRLWDVKTGTDIRRYVHRLDVNSLALSRDGSTMLTGCDDHCVYLWNVQSGEEIKRFTGHTNFVYCVAFAPDGRQFASGGVDKTVRVVDLTNGATVKVFDGHTSSVTNVAFAPDSHSVFSCGDGAAHQWDIATGKEIHRFEPKSGSVLALALSSDGRRLYTGGDDKLIRIWDVASAKVVETLEGHKDSVSCLALSTDGHRLLSGSLDRTVCLWGLSR